MLVAARRLVRSVLARWAGDRAVAVLFLPTSFASRPAPGRMWRIGWTTARPPKPQTASLGGLGCPPGTPAPWPSGAP
eukprot:2322511-Alexandrium_andersonii.AAC.1